MTLRSASPNSSALCFAVEDRDPMPLTSTDLIARTLAAFASAAAATPSITLRAGNAMDDCASPPAFDAAVDIVTDAYFEEFFWGVAFLDAASWMHYLPALADYALRHLHQSSLVVEALVTSLRPPDRDPPRLGALSIEQQKVITELLEVLAFHQESAHQELACQALEEWWIPGSLYRSVST